MTRLMITADTIGGVWQYATDLAGALSVQGIEPVLVTLGPKPSETQRTLLPDIELVETELPLDWLASSPDEVHEAGRTLARLAGELGADIVQLNAPALAADAAFEQPVVAVAHSCVGTWWQAVKGGRIDLDLAWRAELTARGLRNADRAVVPSGAFGAMLQHCYGLDQAPAVVRNGRRAAAVPHLSVEDFAFTAGRLWDEGKNLAAIDRAAAESAIPFKAAGPITGPNGTAIGLAHAEALGSLSDAQVGHYLARRPVFVSAAVYEPFGLAVLEAAQAGCALLLSDIPTFRELWDGAARFVYPHDAAGFARAVDEIVADPALRTQLGQAAQDRARDYTTERAAAGMLALYRTLPVRAVPERAAA